MVSAETFSAPYIVFWAACSLQSNDKNNMFITSFMMKQCSLCSIYLKSLSLCSDASKDYISTIYKVTFLFIIKATLKRRRVETRLKRKRKLKRINKLTTRKMREENITRMWMCTSTEQKTPPKRSIIWQRNNITLLNYARKKGWTNLSFVSCRSLRGTAVSGPRELQMIFLPWPSACLCRWRLHPWNTKWTA